MQQKTSVNGGLIILNNLDSGSHTLKVYHDGVHFNEVSSFNFYILYGFLLDDDTDVCGQ
jgi:hypothetical protein